MAKIIFAILLASVITTAIANLSPLITTLITKKSEEKKMRMELYFHAKEKAYADFSDAVGNCRNSPKSEDVDRLYAACIHAGLLSSKGTLRKLISFAGSSLVKDFDVREYTALLEEATDAMRTELENPQKAQKSSDPKKIG